MRDYKDKSRKLARQRYWEENDRDSYSCPDCGRSEGQIVGAFEVHHKNGEPMDNRPENHVALCRVCHMLREDKKPSKQHIENLREQRKSNTASIFEGNTTPSVYLAGSMEENRETQTWRSSVGHRGKAGTYKAIGSTPVEINSPTEVSYSHGAGPVAGVASDDMNLIEDSDAIIAYFEKPNQVGTLTELVYAVSVGKPALVIFDSDVVDGVGDGMATEWLHNGIEYQFQSRVYWFLINFLTRWGGLETNIDVVKVEDKDQIREKFKNWSWHREAIKSSYKRHQVQTD